jgi:capsular exopolysaccharide synthesis family protein
VINSPSSSFAEAIRSIKVAVDTNPDLTSAKIIGLISSVPGEGKSTIALALGELMAQTGARVTLVDCDLRNPSLSRAIAPKTKAGLMDVVFARQRLEDVVWTDDRTGMTFIPSVRASQSTHSSDILSSVAMKDLFDELRANNDYVIVDLSPLAAGVDVRLTTGFIDAYVLVVKWGQTTIDVVQHALDTAHSVQQSLVGVVLNQINFKQLNRYDSHHAKYYYGSQMTLS